MSKTKFWILYIAGLISCLGVSVAMGMDVNGELKKARIENLSSAPGHTIGRFYYHTSDDGVYVSDGSQWNQLLLSTSTLDMLGLSTSANLRTVLSDETGTGAAYFQGGDAGTPSAINLSNGTALPVGSITGLGTGVGTWLATPSSANAASALTDETGSGSMVFGTTPTIATPVIDDYLDVNEESAPSTPASGKVRVYAKTDKKLYTKNSDGTESAIGSGAGEKNYIAGSSTASGWTCVGDLDVTTTTTASDLPREQTTGSGIKITADSNTQSVADYCYHDFTLDDVDLAKKLKIQFAEKTTGTITNGQLAVVITTQADRTTALHTPITTEIPSLDHVFLTSFDSASTATLSLVIRATGDMTTDGGIVISDVIVGPGVIAQGAVVEAWETCTPAWTTTGGSAPTMSVSTCYQRRIGDSLEVNTAFAANGSGTGTDLAFTIPGSLNIDTTRTQSGSPGQASVGHGEWYDATGPSASMLNVVYSSATTVGATYNNSTYDSLDGADLANNDQVAFRFIVPILEWRDSGTVNLIQDETITEWRSYTPTGSCVSNCTYSGGWRRNGPNMEGWVLITTGGSITSGTLAVDFMPSPYTLDTTALPIATDDTQTIGEGTAFDGNPATRWYPLTVTLDDANTVFLVTPETTGHGAALVQNDNPFTFGSGDSLSFTFSVPIAEWRGRSAGAVGFAAATEDHMGLITHYKGSLTSNLTYNNIANVAAFTTPKTYYQVIDDRVRVDGYWALDVTSAGVNTSWRVTMPSVIEPSANFDDPNDATGVCVHGISSETQPAAGTVYAYSGTKDVEIRFAVPVGTANRVLTCSFVYDK